MNSKNVLLTIVAILMVIVVGGELCVYFGYDLYTSENGVFIRKRVYDATYANMSESELRQKAETGDAYAMAVLSGKMWSANSEHKEVLELAQKSADKNCARGKNMLGTLYAIGYCVPQNDQKAFELFKEAASENDPAALNNIGCYYLNGIVVEKDSIEGLKYLEKSAMQGSPSAQCDLADLYYHGGNAIKKDIDKGIEWFTLAADQGSPIAQYELSKIYYDGEGVTHDYKKAKELCRKAAEQGLPDAKWALENKFNSKND